MNASEARQRFLGLLESFEKDPKAVHKIEKHGRPAAVLLSIDLYESMLETLEILGDEQLMEQLRKSMKDAAEGRTIPWEEARKALNLD